MDIEKLVEGMFADIREAVVGKSVYVRFTTSFDIDEAPQSYRVWTDNKDGMERDWSDTWEADKLHEIRQSRVIFVTASGRYETVDFEFNANSLVASGQGAAYEGACQSWVEMPHDGEPETLKAAKIEITGAFGTIEAPVQNLEIVDVD